MIWFLIVLAWPFVAVALALLIGGGIEQMRGPSKAPCWCGCGRMVPADSGWDGLHGPGPS